MIVLQGRQRGGSSTRTERRVGVAHLPGRRGAHAGVRWVILLACVVACIATGRAAAQQPMAEGMLRVASSGEHVWVVVPTPGAGGMNGARIMHHAADMGPLGMRQAFEFARPVVDLVATGDRLWVVFGPEQGRPGEPVFDVASTTVRRNMAVGTYYDLPIGSMQLEPQVPAGGWRGIAALPGSPAAAHRPAGRLELVRPTATAWVGIGAPDDLAGDAWLVPWPVAGQPSAALAAIDGAALVTWTRTGEAWSSQRWPIPSAAVHVVPGASRPAVVDLGGGRRDLLSLTPSGSVVAHALHQGPEPWCVAGRGDRFVVFSQRAEGLFMSVLGLDGDSASASEPVKEQARTTGLWLHLPLLGAVTVAALLAVFLLRSGPEAAGVLPAGWEPLPLGRRALALVVDLAPGAAASMLLLHASGRELLAMPSWTADSTAAAASSLMLVVGWGLASIVESLVGSSLGKWLVGGVVVSTEPGTPWRASILRRAARCALALVVLFAPALAFLTMVHPALQGLPEQLTRTAVARRAREPVPPPPPMA